MSFPPSYIWCMRETQMVLHIFYRILSYPQTGTPPAVLLPERIQRYDKHTSSIQYGKKCASHPAVLRSAVVPAPWLLPGQVPPSPSDVLPHLEAHKGLPEVLYPDVYGSLYLLHPGSQGPFAVLWCGLSSVLLREVLLQFHAFWQGKNAPAGILRTLLLRLEHRLQLPAPS